MDCSPPGFSVHGILQARILKWVAISFSRGSSQPRDQTQVSRIAGRCFNFWPSREARPCDPAIPLLHGSKGTCTPVFIVELFTIAKTWKQPKCLLTDEWIKMWYVYSMECYSAIRKNDTFIGCGTRTGGRMCDCFFTGFTVCYLFIYFWLCLIFVTQWAFL